MFQSFYSTVAQASFTLLGLWWVVLQIRYGPWMRDRRVRRAVYDISLYFLLPGMMSLMALLAADASTIWRVSGAGALGPRVTIEEIAPRSQREHRPAPGSAVSAFPDSRAEEVATLIIA